jgi:hypothetical protein
VAWPKHQKLCTAEKPFRAAGTGLGKESLSTKLVPGKIAGSMHSNLAAKEVAITASSQAQHMPSSSSLDISNQVILAAFVTLTSSGMHRGAYCSAPSLKLLVITACLVIKKQFILGHWHMCEQLYITSTLGMAIATLNSKCRKCDCRLCSGQLLSAVSHICITINSVVSLCPSKIDSCFCLQSPAAIRKKMTGDKAAAAGGSTMLVCYL